jgi:hypothetical protein
VAYGYSDLLCEHFSHSYADGLTWQEHHLGVSAGTPVQLWYFSTSERIACLQYYGMNNHRHRVDIGCHCVHHAMLYCYAFIILSPIYRSFLITMALISQRCWSSKMEACIRTTKWTFHVMLRSVCSIMFPIYGSSLTTVSTSASFTAISRRCWSFKWKQTSDWQWHVNVFTFGANTARSLLKYLLDARTTIGPLININDEGTRDTD